jgi:ferredoxin-NADP reductase
VQGYFLACQAQLEQDLEISLSADSLEVPADIENVENLAVDVLRVTLRPTQDFEHRAGQFVTLVRSDGLARAYSIASLPRTRRLELHVRVLPGGAMSSWLSERASIGRSLKLRGPAGECFYLRDKPDEPLLLAGVGTGLAPLWGVLSDALGAGHQGPIELWHGARNADGLYLHRELLELARLHPRFSYHACVLEGATPDGATRGKLDEALMASASSFAGRRIYLCGDAPLVQLLRRKVFMKGAASSAIHADPFIGSAPQSTTKQ